MSKRTSLPATLLLVALATTACGTQAATVGPDGSASPTAAPPSPPPVGIVHPTGATEIVLRFDEAGGFVPVEFSLGHVPYFTLYGDGTVVYVITSAVSAPTADGVTRGLPIQIAKLSESQVQDLLLFALTEGGLANARERYDNPMVADAPTAVFEINADGDSKTVSVMALGMEDPEPGADTAIKKALSRLGELLRDFDQSGTVRGEPYVATAYRSVLLESPGAQGVNVRSWPWPELTSADFKLPADPNVLQQQTRLMTPAEAEAMGITHFEDGVQGLWYRVDDKLYSFVLRPLLPDEQA